MVANKKLVVCLVAFALLVTSVVTGHAAEKSILDKILERGVVRVGMILTLPPIAYLDETGKPVGYEPDIAKELADTLGVKVEIVELTGPSRVPAVAAGKCDVAIADFTRTLERSKTVNFLEVPYMLVGVKYLVRADSPYKTLKELQKAGNKLVLGFSRGGTSEIWAEKLLPDAQYKRFEHYGDLWMALKTELIDVWSEDSITADTYAKKYPDLCKTLPGVHSREDIVAAVAYGDFKWWHWLNLFFYELNASGKNAELYKKWFGTEPPPLEGWTEIR